MVCTQRIGTQSSRNFWCIGFVKGKETMTKSADKSRTDA
jgi:hypothetical protein